MRDEGCTHGASAVSSTVDAVLTVCASAPVALFCLCSTIENAYRCVYFLFRHNRPRTRALFVLRIYYCANAFRCVCMIDLCPPARVY